METVGVIAEYNPFHNGHLYHLNKVKEMFPDSKLVLVLIGNFTQRGEPSIINKWDKTNIALSYGYDLVVELPYIFASSSANNYAYGVVKILNYLKCNYLVFGSETNDVELFKKIVNVTKDNNEYESKIKEYLNKGYNYPKSCSLALYDISKIQIDKPNDVLALEYVRSIINLNSNIIPVSIKRTNEYNSEKLESEISSASAIRKNINDIDVIKKQLPNESLNMINNISINDYFNYLKYNITINNNLSDILDVTEGIENKIKKEINNASSVDELISLLKSKRYSYNRLKRMIIHIICNTKKDIKYDINYIRVLGLTDKGKEIIKGCKDINIPIITKFKKEHFNLLSEDVKASIIYGLITKYDYKLEFRASIKK